MEPLLDRRLFHAPAPKPKRRRSQSVLTTVAALGAATLVSYGALYGVAFPDRRIAALRSVSGAAPSDIWLPIERSLAAAGSGIATLDSTADAVYRWLCPYIGTCTEEYVAAPAPTLAPRPIAPIPSSVPAVATATTSPIVTAPAPIQQTIINQPVIERVIVRESTTPQENAISNSTFESRLQQFEQSLNARFAASAASANATFVSAPVFAQSQKIDNLSNVSITNPTITGGSIGASSISGTIANAIETATAIITSLTATEVTFTRATTTDFVATNSTTTFFAVTGSATSSFAGGILASRLSATATSTLSGLILDGSGLRFSTLDCSSFANGGTLTTDSSGNVVCAADDGGSGSSVGGSNTQVQFNNNGSFAGDAGFTYASSSDLLTVTNASTSAFTAGYASTSNLIASNSFTFRTVTGFLKATAGAVATALIDLANDVTGILPIANGGTGWSTITANTLLTGNGSGALATTTIGNGLALSAGVLSTSFGTTTANTWTALQSFSAGASTTRLSIFEQLYVGGTATTTIRGDGVASVLPYASTTALTVDGTAYFPGSGIWNASGNVGIGTTTPGSILSVQGVGNFVASATSTFYNGLSLVGSLNVGGSATSTFAQGINLSGGCFSINGTCVGGGSGASLSVANTWTALQSFAAGASTTQFSVFDKAYFGGTATTTIDSGGNLSVAGTSVFSGLASFTNASTTRFSIFDRLYVGGTATTTILGSATSTFGAGIEASVLNITSSSATSTFANGIQLSGGCFLVNGSCIGSGSGSGGGQLLAIYATSTAGTSTVNFNGASGSAPSFSAGTLTLPSNTSYIVVEAWGGGGGGGADTTNNGATGTPSHFNGVATSTGGTGGEAANQTGGSGGTGAGGDLNLTGEGGSPGGTGIDISHAGGSAPRGGSGAKGGKPYPARVGGAFGGGGSSGGKNSGGGGGAGYTMKTFTSLASSYNFHVGAGGAGGAAGDVAGGAGGTGGVVIRVYTTGISNGSVASGVAGQFAFYDAAGTNLSATSSIYIATSGNVGIGTTSPWGKLSITAADNASIPQFVVASSSATSLIVTSSGNVGIGTTTPSNLLHVEGTGATPLTLYRNTASSNVGLEFRNNTASWFAGQGSGGSFNIDTDGNLGTGALFALTTGGNVGIGNTTPIATFDIASTTQFDAGDTTTGDFLRISQKEGTSGVGAFGGGLVFTKINSTKRAAAIASVQTGSDIDHNGLAFFTHSSVSFTDAVSEAMRITHEGNVGIGTTSPSANLEVSSDSTGELNLVGDADNNSSNTDIVFKMFNNGSLGGTNVGELRYDESDDTFELGYGQNQNHLVIKSTGNVGIGTTNPDDGKLEVKGGTVCVDTDSNDSATSCIANESDERLKENITSISASSSLDIINALNPVSFDWRANDPTVLAHWPALGRYAGNEHSIGLIAQQVMPILPEALSLETVGDAEVQYYQLDYTKFIPHLIGAVKELWAKVQDLGQKIAALVQSDEEQNAKIQTLEARVQSLESQLGALLAGTAPQGGGDLPAQAGSPAQQDGEPDTEAPVITINGNSPATLQVGDTYNDLGATVTDNVDANLGIRIFIGSTPMEYATLDTSEPNEWHISYVATDNAGNTATSTRIVIVESPSIVPEETLEPEPTLEQEEEPAPQEQ